MSQPFNKARTGMKQRVLTTQQSPMKIDPNLLVNVQKQAGFIYAELGRRSDINAASHLVLAQLLRQALENLTLANRVIQGELDVTYQVFREDRRKRQYE